MNNWALIIGIERYAKPLGRLDAALNDASDIRSSLIESFDFSGERIIWLPNASKKQILHAIDNKLSTWPVKKADQLLVFFAGHGIVRESKGKKSWYLIPSDAKIRYHDKPKRTYRDWDSFIPLSEFLRINDRFKGRHIFYIFDSCHSGFAVKAPDRGADKSCSILVAATAKQKVVDSPFGEKHSILTATILDALSGWGALNEEIHPDFSAGDLRDFVEKEAARRIRERLPLVNMTPFGADNPTEEGSLFMFYPQSPRLPWKIMSLVTSLVVEQRQEGVEKLSRISDQASLKLRDQAFERILHEDESPTVLSATLHRIGLVGDASFYDLVCESLNSDSPMIARAAIHSLRNLAVRNTGIQKQTIRTLKDLFNKERVEGIRILIDESLAKLKDPGGTKRTLERMRTSGGRVRSRSLEALQPTEELIANLLSALEHDKEWQARRLAAEVLGRFCAGNAATLLGERAKDPTEHWLVRFASVEALGQIANHLDTATAEDLEDVLAVDRSLNVRTATAECLGIVPPEVVDAQRSLVRALRTDSEWRVRRAAVEALALSLSVGALDDLIAALRDAHFRVRKEAVFAIGALSSQLHQTNHMKKLSEDALNSAAEDDPSDYVRRAAGHELKRID
ncbi:MAG TPA: HEAT repeat domain-containing protein [Pyrinomonadaceae bacterium]|nr:HEAT repeat domain-containing protein [Pyrinomonadaceae bacterium]